MADKSLVCDPPSRPSLVEQFEPEFVDEDAAARVLGFEVGTLQQWRVRGGGPPYLKFSRGNKQGAVRYDLAELRAWARCSHRRQNSSE
jgi:hypothetical protein